MHRETEVIAAEEQRYRAMENATWDALTHLLDDDLVYTHSDSSSDTKAGYLALLRDGVYAYESVISTERRIVVVGSSSDVALCCGRMRMRGRLNGVPRDLDNRYLAVYVRRADGWKLSRYQPTPVGGGANAAYWRP